MSGLEDAFEVVGINGGAYEFTFEASLAGFRRRIRCGNGGNHLVRRPIRRGCRHAAAEQLQRLADTMLKKCKPSRGKRNRAQNKSGRSDRIRTCDVLLPKQVL